MSSDDISADQIAAVRRAALVAITAATDLAALDAAKAVAVGRKGELTAIQRCLGGMDEAARRQVGAAVNAARADIAAAESRQRSLLEQARDRVELVAQTVDVTLPPRTPRRGSLHPIAETMDAMCEALVGLGYRVISGPEVESEWFNFDALNTPADHPARTLQDTIYVASLGAAAATPTTATTGLLLRTQTSPVQIRTMLGQAPPVYVVVPGRVYRSDTADATHLPMFHQIEGLAIDHELSFADLRGTLEAFVRALLGPDTRIRLRPHYFPFTEPSCEVDAFYDGRWMELLGAGMVHPNVLINVGYDPEVVRGFAWGIGVDRIAMLRHGLDDLRLLVENDLRFLSAF